MILYFADRLMNIIGTASTSLPKGIVITNDAKTEDVDSGASAFECELSFDKSNRAKVEGITEVGNYLLRSDKGENEFYTIIDCEIDTKRQTAYIYAEDAGLDLLNDIIEPYEANDFYEIGHYVERTASDAGWEIGVNELEGITRKLKFADEQTGTARLLSIAKEFNDCEISFSFEVKGLQVTRKLINIYEQRGKDTDIQLRLNKQIDSIVTKKTINNLATALKPKGSSPADGENPITLLNHSYDDGDFYVDGDVLKSREALKNWERYLWKGNDDEQTAGHIVKTFTYDTTSQAVLCEKAIEELKKIRDKEVNYEVEITELPESARIGDRVNVIDENGKLYLSTRLLKLVTSVVKQSIKATLGENILKGSGIEDKVIELAQQFSAIAKSRVFYTWIAYADDENGTGITTEPEGKAFIGIAANKTEETVDISDPSVFTWSKVKG
ncbi:MAG: phage tail protein, partial [Clostridia bacterium]|nr:phage tail protein [Clostridia bacterium]